MRCIHKHMVLQVNMIVFYAHKNAVLLVYRELNFIALILKMFCTCPFPGRGRLFAPPPPPNTQTTHVLPPSQSTLRQLNNYGISKMNHQQLLQYLYHNTLVSIIVIDLSVVDRRDKWMNSGWLLSHKHWSNTGLWTVYVQARVVVQILHPAYGIYPIHVLIVKILM